jgi:corrinoid protein of di/trimethylamine methyltransferase
VQKSNPDDIEEGDEMSEDINITQLSTEELLRLMQDDLYNGLADEITAEVKEALGRKMVPYDVLTKGLLAGMDMVGQDFRDGVLFVPEVLMAAKAMRAGMEILRPRLAETGIPKTGTVVIGTIKGDIHDIGKNLVAMMLEGAGFEVYDLGADQSAENFLAAVKSHQPDVLGMSALLTTTMPYMGEVIRALEKEGLRQGLTILVGGAPLNEAFAEGINADAYCRDATMAVDMVKKLMSMRK